jgi:hypothetical protein
MLLFVIMVYARLLYVIVADVLLFDKSFNSELVQKSEGFVNRVLNVSLFFNNKDPD